MGIFFFFFVLQEVRKTWRNLIKKVFCSCGLNSRRIFELNIRETFQWNIMNKTKKLWLFSLSDFLWMKKKKCAVPLTEAFASGPKFNGKHFLFLFIFFLPLFHLIIIFACLLYFSWWWWKSTNLEFQLILGENKGTKESKAKRMLKKIWKQLKWLYVTFQHVFFFLQRSSFECDFLRFFLSFFTL